MAENGYATPARVADALKLHAGELSTPILDFACGTGLSGLALQQVGFTTLDGMDITPEMLSEAEKKGIYRNLITVDVADETPIAQDSYRIITAIGAIGTGAAPASCIHTILRALPKGGLMGLSLNDHALAEPEYETTLCQWLDCGAARLLFKEYGSHLPARGIKSYVYIVEKA